MLHRVSWSIPGKLRNFLTRKKNDHKRRLPICLPSRGATAKPQAKTPIAIIIVMGGNVKIKRKGVKRMKQMEVLKIAKTLTESPELIEFMKIAVTLPSQSIRKVIERMEAEA